MMTQPIMRPLYISMEEHPYGSEVSIQAASMAIDVIKRYVTNRVVQNTVLSFKGSGYFFQQAGMKHTERYEKQITPYQEVCLTDL